MTGTEVATVSQGGTGLALSGSQSEWTPAQRAALAQIGIDQAPQGDQQVFLHVAQRVGLDPFARQIYLIGRNDRDAPGGKKWTIQTGIDGFRVFSERHDKYAGDLGAEWCGEDGVWHDVWVGKAPPVAARFTVLRNDREHPIRAVAHFTEYVQTKFNGEPTRMWQTMPAGQIAKCAEAMARRRAFPQDLSSIYSDEEMGHLDNPRAVVIDQEQEKPTEPDWDALTRQHEAAGDREELAKLWKLARGMRPNDVALQERIAQAGERVKQAATAAETETPADPPADGSKAGASNKQMRQLFALLNEHGISRKDVRLRFAAHALERDGLTSYDQLSGPEVDQLIGQLQQMDRPAAQATAAEPSTQESTEDDAPIDGEIVTDPPADTTDEGDRP